MIRFLVKLENLFVHSDIVLVKRLVLIPGGRVVTEIVTLHLLHRDINF